MLDVLDGREGSGKTYIVTKLALKYLGNGGVVGGNIPWIEDEVGKFLLSRYRWDLQPGQLQRLDNDQVKQFWRYVPPGSPAFPSLVIISEAGRFWNARDWANASREMLDFLALGRHECTDILLEDQDVDNVDKQFRRLVQHYIHVSNLRAVLGGKPGGDMRYKCTCFIKTTWHYDRKTRLDWEIVIPDPAIFRCYDSFSHETRRFTRLDGKGHFGKDGKLKRRMSMGIKTVLLLMLFAAFAAAWWGKGKLDEKYFRHERAGIIARAAVNSGPVPSANVQGNVSPVQPGSAKPDERGGSPEKANSYFEGVRFARFKAWGKGWVQTEEMLYERGKLTSEGYVKGCTGEAVLLLDLNGKEKMILKDTRVAL